MNARNLLLAVGVATIVAACGSVEPGGDDRENGESGPGGTNSTSGAPNAASPGAPGAPSTPVPGNLPTNSAAGKAFFAQNVQPILEAKCATCHTQGGIGNPTYIVKGDASKTYDMVYLNGFAVASSRIVVKGAHSGGAAPELSAAEKTTFGNWIAVETKDGGTATQTNVLEKFGSCFDKAKFDAIGFGQLRTIRRQNGNNPQKQNENANNCTGCDNKPCNTCHSADDVTGFVMAVGNNILPADYTFERTKLLAPPFIRQYVSTTPTGEPEYNPGVLNKSTNSIEKGLAYSHPMFKPSAEMQTALKAFVDDAVTKYKAGTCGK